ncbi:MAG: sugar phosphate isomerase/epimerase family protein [Candidatus Ornithospirochaeta sp.]
MRFGVCAGSEKAKDIKEAGFDYIELPLNKVGTVKEDEWKRMKEDVESVGLPVEAYSLLLPKTMKIIGPEYNEKEMLSYLDTAFSRMLETEGRVVSFGSGKSRFIPEGVFYKDGWQELVDVTKKIVEKAKEYGVEIAIETLNRNETNLINFLTEGAALSSLTGASLLVDVFHLMKENEPFQNIVLCGPFAHAHIAERTARLYPTEKNEDVIAFFSSLKKAGYDKRLSIEGKTTDFITDGPKALRVLKETYMEVYNG